MEADNTLESAENVEPPSQMAKIEVRGKLSNIPSSFRVVAELLRPAPLYISIVMGMLNWTD